MMVFLDNSLVNKAIEALLTRLLMVELAARCFFKDHLDNLDS